MNAALTYAEEAAERLLEPAEPSPWLALALLPWLFAGAAFWLIVDGMRRAR